MLNWADFDSFSDVFSVHLSAYFVGISYVLRFEFRKFRIFKILKFHPCSIQRQNYEVSFKLQLVIPNNIMKHPNIIA